MMMKNGRRKKWRRMKRKRMRRMKRKRMRRRKRKKMKRRLVVVVVVVVVAAAAFRSSMRCIKMYGTFVEGCTPNGAYIS